MPTELQTRAELQMRSSTEERIAKRPDDLYHGQFVVHYRPTIDTEIRQFLTPFQIEATVLGSIALLHSRVGKSAVVSWCSVSGRRSTRCRRCKSQLALGYYPQALFAQSFRFVCGLSLSLVVDWTGDPLQFESRSRKSWPSLKELFLSMYLLQGSHKTSRAPFTNPLVRGVGLEPGKKQCCHLSRTR